MPNADRSVALALERITKIIQSNADRLRDLEERINRLEVEVESIESAATEDRNQNKNSFADLNSKLGEIKDVSLADLENKIREIENALKKTVDKADFWALKETVEIYNPVTSEFVTREEAQRMLEKKRG